MKKIFVLSAIFIACAASVPSNALMAQEIGEPTEESANTDGAGRNTSRIIIIDGCYYRIETRSILWGLITWESEPIRIGCGSGFA